jgi:hypothetical protein
MTKGSLIIIQVNELSIIELNFYIEWHVFPVSHFITFMLQTLPLAPLSLSLL